MKQPIQSVKHILQHQAVTTAQGAVSFLQTVEAVKDYTGVANECPVGAVVKAVYVEVWILSDTTAFGNVNITVEKKNNAATNMTAAQSTTLDAYPNKAQILYTTQGLTSPNTANPTPFIRQWIAIPKGKQRMALGDTIGVNISAIVLALEACGMQIFKHYT